MSASDLNLVQAVTIWKQQWKTLLLFTTLTMAVATITVFVVPGYYRSHALLLSANPALADKRSVLNNNTQYLYSYFGSGDDLDRLTGIGLADTSYLQLVRQFNMIDYYELTGEKQDLLRYKAMLKLRKDLRFQKTAEGQLKILAWTKNKQLSADLVNAMVQMLEKSSEAIWQQQNQQAKQQIDRAITQAENQYKQLSDSLQNANSNMVPLLNEHQQTLLSQLREYRNTANQFQLISATAPKALYLLEAATPAVRPERPDKLGIVLSAALAGLLCGMIILLLSDRNKKG